MEEEQNWQIVDGNHLYRVYKFKDFKEALGFVNTIGEISEKENHHPDITLSYGIVKINLWTHKEGKITEKDNELARKFEEEYKKIK